MSDEIEAEPERPRQISLATIALSLLGVVLLFVASIYVFSRDTLVQQSIQAAEDAGLTEISSPESLRRAFLIFSIVSLVLAVVAFVAALFIRRRRGWARYLGISIGALFGVFALQSLIGGGNLIFGAVEIAIAVVVVAALVSKQTAAWFAWRGTA